MDLFRRWILDRGLRFNLAMVMLILLVCSMGIVFIPYYWGRQTLKSDLEKSFLDLSNAIRVSVDQLTAPASSDADRLREYVESLRKSGIQEVSIVGEDMGVIDSTNPKAIGRTAKIRMPRKELIINATFGEGTESGAEKLRSKDLVVPVTVGGDTLGYIHVRMHIDDFTEAIRNNLYLRLASTLVIFAVGFALAVTLSAHYVRSLDRLAHAAESVAAGDLAQELPVMGNDEVGRLTRSYNEMIARLRGNRELEEKIRESQYLTQLGRFSSGVAHEIRNPLNFIGLAVDRLDALAAEKTAEAATETAQIHSRIKEEIRKLNDLVTNFVSYGRPALPQRTPVFVPEIVESVLQMASDRLRSQRILVRREFCEGHPLAVDPDMLRRAVVNLVGNAIDAMPDGGELRVAAGYGNDGRYALAIADSGAGIPDGDRERIFEPYFTTKSSGLGLGLGLTRKIVEAHGGEIAVESEPGKGTCIRAFFPGGAA